MPRDFKVSTDAGQQLIFDPEAVKDFAMKDDWYDVLAAEVKAGRLASRSFGDGTAFFRVFLEGELVPASMEKRAGPAVKGLLQVPSGRLHFAGGEALASAPTELLELTPGRYEITLREMEWGELVEALADRAARKTSALGSKASDVLGLLAGCFVLLTGVGGVAALIAVLDSGWTAWSAAWPWLLGFAAVLGLLTFLWRTWPGAQEAMAAQRAVQDRFPTTLVRLRRLGDGEGPSEGCVLDDQVQ